MAFTNLMEVLGVVKEYDQNKKDGTYSFGNVQFDVQHYATGGMYFSPDGNLVLPHAPQDVMPKSQDLASSLFGGLGIAPQGNGGDNEYPLTENALSQVLEKLSPAGKNYLASLPPHLLAKNLNYLLGELAQNPSNRRSDGWLVRVYNDKVRAVLSSKHYYPFLNSQLLQATVDVMGNDGMALPHNLVRPVVTHDQMYLKVIFRENKGNDGGTNEGNNYGFGFCMVSEETGNGRVGLYPVIQRHSCTNSIVMQEGGWGLTHSQVMAKDKQSQGFIFSMVRESIANVLKFSAEKRTQIHMAQYENVAFSFQAMVTGIASRYGLTLEQQSMFSTETEYRGGTVNAMHIVNGLSGMAKHIEEAKQFDFEQLAGELFLHPNLVKIELKKGVEKAIKDKKLTKSALEQLVS